MFKTHIVLVFEVWDTVSAALTYYLYNFAIEGSIAMAGGRILVYLLRRDLRLADNPILHHLSSNKNHGFDLFLPVYIFSRTQIEVSGLVKDSAKSPYPQARSPVGNFWRCGPHRAKFVAESVWDLKKSLQSAGSDLLVRFGDQETVVQQLIGYYKNTSTPVGAVWMTEDVSWEERQEEKAVTAVCSDSKVDFKLWKDEKYFIDEFVNPISTTNSNPYANHTYSRDLGLDSPRGLSDVFTSFRKTQEPLRDRPRNTLQCNVKLPPIPTENNIPPPQEPFVDVKSLAELIDRLCRPLKDDLASPPTMPINLPEIKPTIGGEHAAMERMVWLIESGAMSSYAETRNGLLGDAFSTRLSAWLALGCITARQVHEKMVAVEDGKDDAYKHISGYGKGENPSTRFIRFELLWRDYMRLCTKKFGRKLFYATGFQGDNKVTGSWKNPNTEDFGRIMQRFLSGMTGTGLIDASQRELFLTGWTSNRARQNVASFLAKHLEIDWRYGAEWYEYLLVDYDVSSNWANWQYNAGVGNDPRGSDRVFNPVKQAFDYDAKGEYIRAWVPELRGLPQVTNIFQLWTASPQTLREKGLEDSVLATDPLKRIHYTRQGGSKQKQRHEKGGPNKPRNKKN